MQPFSKHNLLSWARLHLPLESRGTQISVAVQNSSSSHSLMAAPPHQFPEFKPFLTRGLCESPDCPSFSTRPQRYPSPTRDCRTPSSSRLPEAIFFYCAPVSRLLHARLVLHILREKGISSSSPRLAISLSLEQSSSP